MALPKTFVNSSRKLKEWHVTTSAGHFNLYKAFLNGHLVFINALELYLPNPGNDNTTINLEDFINNNNPDGYHNVVVYNQYRQPTITTGDLSSLDVTLINQNEIQGRQPGSHALVVTSSLTLDNQGWIRGAGGNGLAGIAGTDNSVHSYRFFYTRHRTNTVCDSSYGPRYWTTSRIVWRSTGCGYDLDVNPPFNFVDWGDQHNVIHNSGDYYKDFGNDYIGRNQNEFTRDWDAPGGTAGSAGRGQSFMGSATSGTVGGDAPAPTGGLQPGTTTPTHHNGDNAVLIAGTDGTAGEDGANWGIDGSGQPAGNAILGSAHLTAASNTNPSHTNGDIN